jgi:acetoin reductase-like protein
MISSVIKLSVEKELNNKIAMVTGCGQGIGNAIALELARNGANIVANDLNAVTATATAEEIMKLGREAFVIKADVTNGEQVKSMVEKAIQKFGRIDILVNNAGIATLGPFIQVTEEEWDKVMSANAKSVFLCSKFVAPQMMKQKEGKIVNVSSRSGKTGSKLYAPYTASKFAVIGLTQVMALELGAYGINVNAVCPGIVETSMLAREVAELEKLTGITADELRKEWLKTIALGRLEKPDDVARVVVFLCSRAASYMTGQAINVTGGREFH